MQRRVFAINTEISWILIASSLLIAPLFSQEKAAAEKPAAEKPVPRGAFQGSLLSAMPADMTLLVRVSSAKGFVEKVKSSPLGQLQNHPDVKKFLEDLKKKTGPQMAKAERDLGFHPIDTLLSIHGEWVLGIGNLNALASALGESLQQGQMPSSLSPESIPLIIAADAGGSAGKVHEALEKLFAFAKKDGAELESTAFNGGTITHLSEPRVKGAGASPKPSDRKDGAGEKAEKDAKPKTDKGKSDLASRPEDDEKNEKDPGSDDDDGDDDDNSDDADGDAPSKEPMGMYVGELGSRFYMSLDRQLLEGSMQKADAERADGLVKNALFQETHAATGTGDLFVFVNAKQLTSSIGTGLSATFFAFFWQKFEAIFLGASLNNIGLAYVLEKDALSQSAFVHNSGASDGLLGVFKGDTFSPSTAPPVPSDAQNFSSFSFKSSHLSKLVKDTVQLILSFQGQPSDIDTLVEGKVGVKFTDLMSALGKRIHTFTGAVKADNPLASINYVVELKDESPLKKALKKVSELAQGEFDAAKFKDHDIYTLNTGNSGMNVTAAEKLLIFTGSRGATENVISRAGDVSAIPPGGESFKKAAMGMPPQVSLLGFSSSEYMRNLVKSLMDQMGGQLDTEAQPFFKSIGALAELLGSGSVYGLWKDKGFYSTSRTELVKK